jgi:hypothetical protein
LSRYKRPFALQDDNIGAWETWISILAKLGALINPVIIAFSSTYFETHYISYFEATIGKWGARLGFILCFQNAVMLTVYIFHLFLPKVPEKVSHAIERHFYLEKILNGATEETYEFLGDENEIQPPYNPDYDPGYPDLDVGSPHSHV